MQWKHANATYSNTKFFCKIVAAADMNQWKEGLAQVSANGPAKWSLGAFTAERFRRWEWKLQEEEGRLHKQRGDQVEIYQHFQRDRYKFSLLSHSGRMRGKYATVVQGSHCYVTSMKLHTAWPLLEVLQKWGNTWIWEELKVQDGTEWVTQAISNGTHLAVTDGTYKKKWFLDLCSATFILECTQGRGKQR